MARRLLTLVAAFLAMIAGIEGLQRAAAWWHGELPAPGGLDLALLLALPIVAALWWRHLSPFACGRGQCLLPDAPPSRKTPPHDTPPP